MKNAVSVFVRWAELQQNEIKIGSTLKDIQEYERLHHEQFCEWCNERGINISKVYSVCDFSGPGNSRERTANNYQKAQRAGEKWLNESAA